MMKKLIALSLVTLVGFQFINGMKRHTREENEEARRQHDLNRIRSGRREHEDLYKIIGVDSDATIREINRAWRKQALQLKKAGKTNSEEMQYLNNAKDILTDPLAKAAYDNTLPVLIEPVLDGNIAKIKRLMNRANINQTVPFSGGYTALFYVIGPSATDFEIMELLLRNGARVDAQLENGDTPLHIAAEENYPEIVQMLLGIGADPSIKNRDGKTPIDLARLRGNQDVIRVLLQHGER